MTERPTGIKRPRTLVILVVLGVVAMGFGWVMSPDGFPSSLLLEVGAGLFLFAFLLLLERTLERSLEASIEDVRVENRKSVDEMRGRIEGVEDSVADVQSKVARLSDLGEETKQAIAERRAETERVFDGFAENVSANSVSAILREAERIDAVDPNGVRVSMSGTSMRLRISQTDILFAKGLGSALVHLRIENVSGSRLETVTWTDQAPRDIMLKVVEKLQALGQFSEDFDPEPIFGQFLDTVRTAVELKTRSRSGPRDLSPVIEMPNDQWAVTTFGVECLEESYFIEKERFDEDWLAHMRDKTWVDFNKFQQAFEVAKAIRDRERIEAEPAPF